MMKKELKRRLLPDNYKQDLYLQSHNFQQHHLRMEEQENDDEDEQEHKTNIGKDRLNATDDCPLATHSLETHLKEICKLIENDFPLKADELIEQKSIAEAMACEERLKLKLEKVGCCQDCNWNETKETQLEPSKVTRTKTILQNHVTLEQL